MARRRRKGGELGDLFEIAAKLPWQAGVALALVSFLLHAMSTAGSPETPASMKDVGTVAAKTIFVTLAGIGQIVLPVIFLGGAVASYFVKRRRGELVQTVAASDSVGSLNDMTWKEFEALVEEAYRLRGYTVRRIGGDGPDGGVDLVLDRGAEKVLVQCKQWRAMRVGVAVVRELYGAMAAQGAASGIVVTSGSFTPDAVDFASGRNIQLMAGRELHELIRDVRAAEPRLAGMTGPRTQGNPRELGGCPVCGSPMVRRTAKRGANSGEEFYGCSRFPVCRGTRSLA